MYGLTIEEYKEVFAYAKIVLSGQAEAEGVRITDEQIEEALKMAYENDPNSMRALYNEMKFDEKFVQAATLEEKIKLFEEAQIEEVSKYKYQSAIIEMVDEKDYELKLELAAKYKTDYLFEQIIVGIKDPVIRMSMINKYSPNFEGKFAEEISEYIFTLPSLEEKLNVYNQYKSHYTYNLGIFTEYFIASVLSDDKVSLTEKMSFLEKMPVENLSLRTKDNISLLITNLIRETKDINTKIKFYNVYSKIDFYNSFYFMQEHIPELINDVNYSTEDIKPLFDIVFTSDFYLEKVVRNTNVDVILRVAELVSQKISDRMSSSLEDAFEVKFIELNNHPDAINIKSEIIRMFISKEKCMQLISNLVEHLNFDERKDFLEKFGSYLNRINHLDVLTYNLFNDISGMNEENIKNIIDYLLKWIKANSISVSVVSKILRDIILKDTSFSQMIVDNYLKQMEERNDAYYMIINALLITGYDFNKLSLLIDANIKKHSNAISYIIGDNLKAGEDLDKLALKYSEYFLPDDWEKALINTVKYDNNKYKTVMDFVRRYLLSSKRLTTFQINKCIDSIYKSLNDDEKIAVLEFKIRDVNNVNIDVKEEEKTRYQKLLSDISQMKTDLQNKLIESLGKAQDLSVALAEEIMDICDQISKSNSSELRRLEDEVISSLLGLEIGKMKEALKEIEETFLKNNLPTVGKIYKVFEIIHKDKSLFSAQSPVLGQYNNKNHGPIMQKIILFHDVLKASIYSNNRSLIEYLNTIIEGNKVLEDINEQRKSFDDLSLQEQELLSSYLNHVISLYNHGAYGKNKQVSLSGDIANDVKEILKLYSTADIKELPDRIVSLYANVLDLKTAQELKDAMEKSVIEASKKGAILAQNGQIELKQGDFIKGIGRNVEYIGGMLQNGILCKEFLGSSADSDATPLDTDLSRISEDCPSLNKLQGVAASAYGPIFIILKNSDKLQYTEKNKEYPYDGKKYEIFKTGVMGQDHYGIRSGFPSTMIDYFITQSDDKSASRLKHEIVMNGFYIPVVDGTGKVIFPYEEYLFKSSKMQGLSYYGKGDEYEFASELDNFSVTSRALDVQKNIEEVGKIRNTIIKLMQDNGLNIILGRGKDMSKGVMELIDTGSTGRGTNKMDDFDFDFIIRLDRQDYLNKNIRDSIEEKLRKAFPGMIVSGDNVREHKMKLNVDGKDIEFKIDISFIMKNDKLAYSTDECIKDRLSNIKKLEPEKHEKILQNIILAKQILKGAYKPKHAGGGKAQGGLGGVGVENWILQNGGSLERAARTFLLAASQSLNFDDFCSKYQVWDFGENHLHFNKEDKYMHDEFISNNMSPEGYEKMKVALKEYLNTLDKRKTEEKEEELSEVHQR